MARLYYLLNLAQHRVSQYANRECERLLDVTASQLGALFVLGERPNLRQSELADELGCTKGAITAMTERLCSAGLVKKTSCQDDGRASRLQLSVKGKKTIKRGVPLVAKVQSQLTDDFSEAEIETVARFLQSASEIAQ